MESPVLLRWLVAFALSLAIEVPLYVLLGRHQARAARVGLAGALGTCITHPLLWFAWPYAMENHLVRTLTGEVLVCIIEAAVLHGICRTIPPRQALGIALIANAASYGTGILLRLAGIL